MENQEGETVLVPPKDLDELIQELHKVFANDRVNVEYVKALLSSYRSNPKDWKKFAKFDTHRYEIKCNISSKLAQEDVDFMHVI